MIAKSDLANVRQKIIGIEGKKIILTLRRGHKRSQTGYATIGKAYPSIFTLTLDGINGEKKRTLSFSYADILTKVIELSITS